MVKQHGVRRVGAVILALGLLVASSSNAFAHARYDRSEPPAGSALDGTPFVLRAWFTQELTSKSTIRVVDAYGTQVDLGDGGVDLDDPDRKAMTVSVPELPPGVYTVEFTTVSAEDGDAEPGSIAFGVGMTPPSADETTTEPAGGAIPTYDESADTAPSYAY
jgi:methionine-rich copper-binding protein CopC